MVRSDGRMVITDFGIARAIASTKITASHAIVGTALYMAPEQAEGAGTGPASDLYSIGVVCYELLTGTPPFVGEGVLEVALKHVRQPVPELPGTFPAAVRELVAKALAKKPEDRYADAAEMAAAPGRRSARRVRRAWRARPAHRPTAGRSTSGRGPGSARPSGGRRRGGGWRSRERRGGEAGCVGAGRGRGRPARAGRGREGGAAGGDRAGQAPIAAHAAGTGDRPPGHLDGDGDRPARGPDARPLGRVRAARRPDDRRRDGPGGPGHPVGLGHDAARHARTDRHPGRHPGPGRRPADGRPEPAGRTRTGHRPGIRAGRQRRLGGPGFGHRHRHWHRCRRGRGGRGQRGGRRVRRRGLRRSVQPARHRHRHRCRSRWHGQPARQPQPAAPGPERGRWLPGQGRLPVRRRFALGRRQPAGPADPRPAPVLRRQLLEHHRQRQGRSPHRDGPRRPERRQPDRGGRRVPVRLGAGDQPRLLDPVQRLQQRRSAARPDHGRQGHPERRFQLPDELDGAQRLGPGLLHPGRLPEPELHDRQRRGERGHHGHLHPGNAAQEWRFQ